jgi:hypothetical protein
MLGQWYKVRKVEEPGNRWHVLVISLGIIHTLTFIMHVFVTVMLALEDLKKSRGVRVELKMLLPV